MSFDESRHPRVPPGSPEGGEFTSTGGGIDFRKARETINKVSSDLKFDPSRFDLSTESKTFVLNGQTMFYAGSAELKENGRLTLFINHTTPETAAGIVAHEIEHAKFNQAIEDYRVDF